MKYQNTIGFLEEIALFFSSQKKLLFKFFCFLFLTLLSDNLVSYFVSPHCCSLEILSEAATRGQHDCISSRKSVLGFLFSWQVWGAVLRTKHIITERLNP